MALWGRLSLFFGGSNSGSAQGAFPFSLAKNLLTGAMDASARWWNDKDEEGASSKKMKMGWGAPPPPPFIDGGRLTAGLSLSEQ